MTLDIDVNYTLRMPLPQKEGEVGKLTVVFRMAKNIYKVCPLKWKEEEMKI